MPRKGSHLREGRTTQLEGEDPHLAAVGLGEGGLRRKLWGWLSASVQENSLLRKMLAGGSVSVTQERTLPPSLPRRPPPGRRARMDTRKQPCG